MPAKKCIGRPVDHSKDRAILAAAHTLLFSKDSSRISIEAVARLAGVSKMTIYSRYASREELLQAVHRQQADFLVRGLSVSPGEQNSVRDVLVNFGFDLLSFLLGDEHLNFMRALHSTPDSPTELIRKIYRNGPQNTQEKLTVWMKHAHNSRLINVTQPEKSAELFLGMLIGLDIVREMYGISSQRRGSNIKPHVEWVVELFLNLHEI